MGASIGQEPVLTLTIGLMVIQRGRAVLSIADLDVEWLRSAGVLRWGPTVVDGRTGAPLPSCAN